MATPLAGIIVGSLGTIAIDMVFDEYIDSYLDNIGIGNKTLEELLSESTDGLSDDLLREWDKIIGNFFDNLNVDNLINKFNVDLDDYKRDSVLSKKCDKQPLVDPKDYQNLSRSGQFHSYDPLALDLDGDGLETVGTRRLSGSLFDHDADGIRTAGGWLSGDDGFLVYDRNGNGLIDNGRELFGDHTLLADGSHATHGYAALAELDDNGDGVVNLDDDTAFVSLQVWRDLN